MGLFTQRPQEPSAWAALPGEPLRPTSPAERLPEESPGLDGLGPGGLGMDDGAVESISIPVAPAPEQPGADGAGPA